MGKNWTKSGRPTSATSTGFFYPYQTLLQMVYTVHTRTRRIADQLSYASQGKLSEHAGDDKQLLDEREAIDLVLPSKQAPLLSLYIFLL